MKRYKLITVRYSRDYIFAPIMEYDLKSLEIVDTYNNDKVIAEFPVKVCKVINGNPDYYGVDIYDKRQQFKMARMLVDQYNRESGYGTC